MEDNRKPFAAARGNTSTTARGNTTTSAARGNTSTGARGIARLGSRMSGHGTSSGRRSSAVSSFAEKSRKSIPFETVTVDKISKHTWQEELNYKLNVLVPLDEELEMKVPIDSYLQQIHRKEHSKWRVIRDLDSNLPLYLKDHKEREIHYTLM